MKRYKKIIAILLSLALIISTFGIFEVSAATNDTRYSKKYLQSKYKIFTLKIFSLSILIAQTL